ncbi:MAG: iron-sulfur cluster assembly accessory protein [Alphaproteobacteria bacterium]|jgi:iron-sulfur cluster assembly protein|nr:iron-sulfur cluster assembly accessory protein [Alphaproteobacteria bacterium]MBT5390470.1 iron-sulfur cluster assembly accessory protein [Alphaproteobacteria bacterium]MBT5654694.1 iron-sulfur cluster assembly accessory protein [Alphaproteobacteria bacterium]
MKATPEKPPVLTITLAAVDQVKNLLDSRNKPSIGIRVSIRSRGCSGLSYTIEYADNLNSHDEVIECDGITLYIDPKAIMFLLGTEMDYIEEKLQSGFIFKNPNEKGRCGCGESFHV